MTLLFLLGDKYLEEFYPVATYLVEQLMYLFDGPVKNNFFLKRRLVLLLLLILLLALEHGSRTRFSQKTEIDLPVIEYEVMKRRMIKLSERRSLFH